MSLKRITTQNEQVCGPLDTYEEILLFVQRPPAWRSLCVELKPHSEYAIRNIDISQNEHLQKFSLNKKASEEDCNFERLKTFCHFTPDVEKPKRHEIKNFIDGSGTYDAYLFYNWAAIDTFCYFSHHLITIPPLGWINVGHAHGVKVIGTVITEWGDGQKLWDKVLASETTWKEFASMLVAITKTLKFDGWLLNVENKIAAPNVLLQFVRFLHASLHEQLPHAQLIWYDSVTRAGALHWQNGLNQLNKDWFDACDGIFTNYSWSEREVAASAAMAAERRADLYVGIDVWGRNFLGGGKFNTRQAIKVAHEHGCSLAIFAPAWTHEAIPDECIGYLGPEERLQHFLLRDRAFWGSIWSYLNTRLPSELPFRTSFCRGQGLKRRLYGEVLCPVPWYNLRHMQYQPNSQLCPHGYLLTTVPNVLRVSKRGILRDSEGGVKFRESFLTSKNEETMSVSKEKVKVDEDRSAQTSTATRQPNSTLTKDDLIKLLKKFFEESDDLGLAPPLSLSVSHESKTSEVQFVLTPVPGEEECLELYFGDSFIGGSCLKINVSAELSTDARYIRIFHSDFYVEDTLVACVVTKKLPEFKDQYLNLLLDVRTSEGQSLKVVLAGTSATDENDKDEMVVYPINTPNSDFKEVQKYLLLEEPGFYIPTFNSYDWDVRYYLARLGSGACVAAVSCAGAGPGPGALLLGHFGLCNMLSTTTNEINLAK